MRSFGCRLGLAVALGLLPLAGCHGPERPGEQQLRRANLVVLRRDAAIVYKDYVSASQTGYVALPRGVWPKSFQQFSPERVTVYVDGVALALSPGAEPEFGLYLIPAGMTHLPPETARTRYRPLRDGVLWYEFGSAPGS